MAASMKECAVHLILFVELFYFASGFNLVANEDDFLKYNGYGGVGSHFGYSLTFHKQNANAWAIIGAPLGNCTKKGTGPACETQIKQGTVYKCSTVQNPDCSILEIDIEGPSDYDYHGVDVPLEVKANQWLGGTVFSTGINKDVVVCAPRYVWRGIPLTDTTHYYWPNGKCLIIGTTNWQTKRTLDPCKYEKQGNNFYGYCQAGFSGTSVLDGNTIIMGAPGVSNWKGQLAAYDKSFDYTDFTSRDQLTAGSYMGYAVTSGNFLSEKQSGFVGGAPRAADLKGKAIVYQQTDYSLKITNVLEGQDQIGSYFGSSLCAVNVNGDRLSDLLVGAPFYSVIKDEGRVFVYINNDGAMDLMRGGPLVGDNLPGAKFGSAISATGDLNQDGYDDVAIGAPYQGNGVVFIYHGYNDGVRRKYSQKIEASDKYKAFGSAISGGVDVDVNGYPDLLVGAYESDSAVLIKARPVIDVTASITLSTNIIDINDTKSSCSGKPCLTAEVCFEYSGKKITGDQEIEYTLDLEKDRTNDALKSRVILPDVGSKTTTTKKITLNSPSTKKCDPLFNVHVVQIQGKNNDLWSPVTFDVTFKMTSTDSKAPVLNGYLPKTVREEASFQRNCGSDNKCQPDLQLSVDVTFPDGETKLRLGKVKEMTVDISVVNKEEDAYLSKVNLKFPKDLLYAGVVDKTGVILCSTSQLGNVSVMVTCDIGNPMKQNDKKMFGLKFSTTGVTGQQQTLVLDVEATSSNKDPADKQLDNKKKITIDVKLEADLTIFGAFVPDQVIYKGNYLTKNETSHEEQIGPEVSLTIIVKNEGPSTVEKSQAEINIPSKLDSTDPESYLFYLLPELVVTGSGTCEDLKLNPLNINLTAIDQTVVSRKRRETEVKWGCRTASCRKIKCKIGRLEKGQQTIISIRARLWQSTLIKRNPGLVKLVTLAEVSAPEISLLSQPDNHKPDKVEIVVRANPVQSDFEGKSTPTWIIVVAALGGTILLALAVFGMYKLGFFKRNKPPKDISGPVPEEQEPMKV